MKFSDLAIPVLATCLLVTPAGAETIKFATLAPDGSNWMNILRSAGNGIEADTDGRVDVRFYPGGVMGDTGAVLRRMRLGQLHGGAFTLGALNEIIPETRVFGLPFLYRSLDEYRAVRDEFESRLAEAFRERELVMLETAAGGFAYLFSQLPIVEPGELDTGYKVWVMNADPMSRKTLEKVGVTPVPMTMAEVFTALQTGAINSFASTPSGAIILQWHTRAQYMMDQPLAMTAGVVAVDLDTFEDLSHSDREIVRRHFKAAMSELERRNVADNADARKALEEQGIQIVPQPPEHARTWEQAAVSTRESMIAAGEIEVPWLDEIEARLAELRGN